MWTTTATNVGLGPSQFWASSPRDIWIAGSGVYHFDGAAWTQLSTAGNPIENVWGSAPDDVYLAGSSTSFFHWNGRALELIDGGLTLRVGAIWGATADDVWIAGEAGALLRRRR